MGENKRSFQTINSLELIVINRKSAVIFEIGNLDEGNKKQYDFDFKFTPEAFKELLEHIETISNTSWANIVPKEATNFRSDYNEYYDRQLDNNGYLSIKENVLNIERPTSESKRLYQFNKNKVQSFIFDFRKAVDCRRSNK